MCNLYSMTRNREAILRLFRVSHNRATMFEPQSAIFPGYQAPVVRKATDGERELVVLNWGFVSRRARSQRRGTGSRSTATTLGPCSPSPVCGRATEGR